LKKAAIGTELLSHQCDYIIVKKRKFIFSYGDTECALEGTFDRNGPKFSLFSGQVKIVFSLLLLKKRIEAIFYTFSK
jgi:hypothetical protein